MRVVSQLHPDKLRRDIFEIGAPGSSEKFQEKQMQGWCRWVRNSTQPGELSTSFGIQSDQIDQAASGGTLSRSVLITETYTLFNCNNDIAILELWNVKYNTKKGSTFKFPKRERNACMWEQQEYHAWAGSDPDFQVGAYSNGSGHVLWALVELGIQVPITQANGHGQFGSFLLELPKQPENSIHKVSGNLQPLLNDSTSTYSFNQICDYCNVRHLQISLY